MTQAEQVYAQMDLDLVEALGCAAGFTPKRPPRNYRGIYAERDGADGNLHGEALRRFIKDWREIGGPAAYQRGVDRVVIGP